MNVLIPHLFAILILLSLALSSAAQEWTRFRGPNGTGISQAKTIPTKWSEKDFNWKIPVPGPNHSSPVLWGDKVFLTGTDEKTGQVFVLCVNATDSQILWQKDFSFAPFHKHEHNTFASASPAVDAERVYVVWNDPEH